VAAITYEIGLRAAFAPMPELEPVWQRAARRGVIMGRIGQRLGVDGWAAHSAGLFEECGKALLLRHSPEHYADMLRAAAGDDVHLVQLEQVAFGVCHDALGAAMCESWGLAAPAVASVRHHVTVQAGHCWPPELVKPAVLGLSALAQVMLTDGDVASVVARVAPQAGLDASLALRAVRTVKQQLEHLR
jgi:HD-like signal output (HDOD) protein